MSFYIILYCVFSMILVSLAFGGNLTSTLPFKEKIANKTVNKTQGEELSNTKLTLVSEGGSILANNSDVALSKDNLPTLLALDGELGKSKQKSIVPRKGVGDMLPEHNSVPQPEENSKTIKQKQPIVTNNIDSKTKLNSSKVIPALNASTLSNLQPKPEVHKKPLILSYEALASADKDIHIPVLPSLKTMATNQIPSPNEDNVVVKKYATKANSHPDMIMPIVITILVVPMFAIVGYMAIKRGQEAWKNRHYKRMDFLLDGMYND